jgi:hypothetical protein
LTASSKKSYFEIGFQAVNKPIKAFLDLSPWVQWLCFNSHIKRIGEKNWMRCEYINIMPSEKLKERI